MISQTDPTLLPASIPERRSLHILHLGFENPFMDGAGGGSTRTHEINRRIAAAGHEVTVLTTRYPGWSDRVQDGVRYVPIGFGQGKNRLTRLLGYICRLPTEARHRGATADLVIEDFFAPFSTMAAPMWTRRPTVGVVQWLHARDKARQYRLPFHIIERAGVRHHSRLVAVSRGTADDLLGMNPLAHVAVIGNGIDAAALAGKPEPGRDIVYVGRLELPGKGVDLLISAWAKACEQVEGDLVIAGRGPDEKKIERLVHDAGLSNRVRMVGWVSGVEKLNLLRSARLVVVPSRQETFGLVALEALGSATPVIAFDIPCLREVIPRGCGWLVPPFDVDRLASQIVQSYSDIRKLDVAGRVGRLYASGFDWDALASKQLEEYHGALAPIQIRD